jgi:hypothetical protein
MKYLILTTTLILTFAGCGGGGGGGGSSTTSGGGGTTITPTQVSNTATAFSVPVLEGKDTPIASIEHLK